MSGFDDIAVPRVQVPGLRRLGGRAAVGDDNARRVVDDTRRIKRLTSDALRLLNAFAPPPGRASAPGPAVVLTRLVFGRRRLVRVTRSEGGGFVVDGAAANSSDRGDDDDNDRPPFRRRIAGLDLGAAVRVATRGCCVGDESAELVRLLLKESDVLVGCRLRGFDRLVYDVDGVSKAAARIQGAWRGVALRSGTHENGTALNVRLRPPHGNFPGGSFYRRALAGWSGR
jgi:hypothetical protein